jgi:hypothetical protein
MWTLRTLSVSSRRDCGYMNQVMPNKNTTGIKIQQQRHSSSSKASIELRGPVLPCALRDMTCAMIDIMLLDKYTRQGQSSIRMDAGEMFPEKSEHNESSTDYVGSNSHQFVMFLQAHEGECSISTPKSTGSSSSIDFNGSNIPLLPRNDGRDAVDEPLAWRECGQGDCMNLLAWDVSRTAVVPFK